MARRRGGEFADWSASLRFSGVTVLIVGLVAVGAFIVSPTLSTYVTQQRELAELRESVEERRESVDIADAERLKWQDPAFVRAQARGRLFYVMPGETQLGIIDDVVIPPESTEETSDALTQRSQNWAVSVLTSTLIASQAEVPSDSEVPPAENPEGEDPAAPAAEDQPSDQPTNPEQQENAE